MRASVTAERSGRGTVHVVSDAHGLNLIDAFSATPFPSRTIELALVQAERGTTVLAPSSRLVALAPRVADGDTVNLVLIDGALQEGGPDGDRAWVRDPVAPQ